MKTHGVTMINNLFDGDNARIATAWDNDGLVGMSAPVRVKVKPASAPQAKTNKQK